MFKLAVFSIIFFVLSFTATAEESSLSEYIKNGEPCLSSHPLVAQARFVTDGEAYRNSSDEFVARQRIRLNDTRPMNETYECYNYVDTEVFQFVSFYRTQTLNGDFEETTEFAIREFSWSDCTYLKHHVKCEQLNNQHVCNVLQTCLFITWFAVSGGILVLAGIVACIMHHIEKARKARREAEDLMTTEEEIMPKIVVQNDN